MKNKVYILLIVILSFFTFLIIYNKYSAYNYREKVSQKLLFKHDSIQKKWINRVLVFPDSLYNLKTQELFQKKLKNSKKKFKIISYLDADCSNCVSELKKWKNFLNKSSGLISNTDIYFIATSSNKELLKYQVYDQAKLGYDIYFDEGNHFYKLNSLSNFKAYQTVLVRDTNIVYVGSPIKDKLFQKQILKIIKEN